MAEIYTDRSRSGSFYFISFASIRNGDFRVNVYTGVRHAPRISRPQPDLHRNSGDVIHPLLCMRVWERDYTEKTVQLKLLTLRIHYIHAGHI